MRLQSLPIPIPDCVGCGEICVCGLGIVRKYKEADYEVCFLRGLNDQYGGVHSQIMLIDLIPSINKVFSLLSQQERQMHGGFVESQLMVNATESSAPPSRGRGVKGRGRGSGGGYNGRGQSTKVRTYCGKSGHLVDTCYKRMAIHLLMIARLEVVQ